MRRAHWLRRIHDHKKAALSQKALCRGVRDDHVYVRHGATWVVAIIVLSILVKVFSREAQYSVRFDVMTEAMRKMFRSYKTLDG